MAHPKNPSLLVLHTHLSYHFWDLDYLEWQLEDVAPLELFPSLSWRGQLHVQNIQLGNPKKKAMKGKKTCLTLLL